MKNTELLRKNTEDLNIYNIPEIIHNDNHGDIHTVSSVTQIVFNHVLSITCNEPKVMLRKGNILSLYAQKACDDIVSNIDSALLPDNILDICHYFSDADIQNITHNIQHCSNVTENTFNKLYKIKIISTSTTLSVPVYDHDVVIHVPIVTESKSGIVAIIPIYSNYVDFISSMLAHYENHKGVRVSKIIIWDIMNEKRMIPQGDYPSFLLDS